MSCRYNYTKREGRKIWTSKLANLKHSYYVTSFQPLMFSFFHPPFKYRKGDILNSFLYTLYIGSLQNGWIDFLKVLENGFSKVPWKWMENIDLLSSVLKLEVGGNCWRQQQLQSACVLSLEFEKALKCSPCYDELLFGVEYDW